MSGSTGLGLGLSLSDYLELLSVGARIVVTVNSLADDAALTDPAGQATLVGKYTGTPSWSLVDDAGGKYAIDSSTGAITVADTLSAGLDSIVVAVSGIEPEADNKVALILVTSSSELVGTPMGLLLALTHTA